MKTSGIFLLGLAGCATVAFTVFVTQSAVPLWGLVLVAIMVDAFKGCDTIESMITLVDVSLL